MRTHLRDRIKTARTRFIDTVYKDVIELFRLEKENDPKYTIVELSRSIGFSTTFTYEIMSWRSAPDFLKKAVDENKITLTKAVKILYRSPSEKRDEMLHAAIDGQLNSLEISKAIKCCNHEKITKTLIDEERDYDMNARIAYEIEKHSARLNRTLLSIMSIPKSKKRKIKSILKNTIIKCEDAIDKINKNGW